MTAMPGNQFLRVGLSLACCIWLAGCAGPLGLFGSASNAPPFRDQSMSMQGASDTIVIGTSTKADVVAALGNATVVRFDSGFEVWAYREKSAKAPASGAEFVILFTPAGTVKKTRIRPAYDGRTE